MISNLISVVIGAFLGFLSSIGVFYVQKKNKRMKVRKGLLKDLENKKPQVKNIKKSYEEIGKKQLPVVKPVDNTVYKVFLEDISSLTGEEIEKIIDFYTSLEKINRIIVRGNEIKDKMRIEGVDNVEEELKGTLGVILEVNYNDIKKLPEKLENARKVINDKYRK